MKYSFHKVAHCNMCGDTVLSAKIIGRRLNSRQGMRPKNKVGITTTICQCTNCGLIYSNPQPIPGTIQDHYGVLPEEYWKESYFKSDPEYFQLEMNRYKALRTFQPGLKSLDIGAGIGKQMIALANHGFDAYGLEPSKQFYERAISKMGIAESKIKRGSIEEVTYNENEFDFISFSVVLEHLYDPSTSLKKALRWLKPDGLIHVEVPSANWFIHRLINRYYRLIRTDFVGNLSPMHEPYHLYEFTIDSFKKNALINGYEIVFHEYFVCKEFIPGPDFLKKPLAAYMKRYKKGMQLSIWLKKVT